MRLNIFITSVIWIILSSAIMQSCNNSQPGKIKLSQDYSNQSDKPKTTLSTLQIYPKEQQNIAIFKFKNKTNQPSLDWLQRGLVDLFSNELSQSPFLNIVNLTHLNELSNEIKKNPKAYKDINLAVARKSNAQIFLIGRYYYEGDSLCIDVELFNVNSGKLFKMETVCGAGLERIFSIVGILSNRLRNTLLNQDDKKMTPAQDFTEITNSLDAFRCYSKAMDYYDQFIWDKALEFLKNAVKYDTTFAIAYFKLAQLEFSNKNHEVGERYLAIAENLKENLTPSDRLALNLFIIRREKGFEAHFKALEEAVYDNPSNVELRIDLARRYRHLGFFDKALEHFEIALDYDPSRKSIYNDIAYAYMFIGDYPSALRSIDRYLQLSPNEPNPFDSKGEILLQSGNFKEAKNEFEKALKIYPDFNNSIVRTTEINIFTGDKKESWEFIKRLSKIEKLQQGFADFNHYRLIHYWKFGEFDKFKKQISKNLNKKDIELTDIFLAADFYASIDDSVNVTSIYKKAFSYFKNQLDNDIDYDKNINSLRIFTLVSGYKPRECIKYLKQNIDTKKNAQKKMDIYFTLGLLSARAKQLDQAKKYFELANLPNFHNLLKKIRNTNWNNTWKYVFESSQYFNKGMPASYLQAEMLLNIGKESGRKDLEVLARMMKAQYYKQNDLPGKMEREFNLAGIPTEDKWLFLGPFSSSNINGFDFKYIREDDVNSIHDVKHNNITYRWHHADDRLCDGYIDLKTVLGKSDWKTAYALIKVYSPDEKKAQIRVSSRKACKVFLNDNQVWRHYNLYDDFIDQDIITVVLHPGENKILLKLANNSNNWGYYFRITDENGNGINDLKYYPADEPTKGLALN